MSIYTLVQHSIFFVLVYLKVSVSPTMSDRTLELSDEQREEVRQMLSKFSTKKSSKQQQESLQKEDRFSADPDPLEMAEPGASIDWTELTAKTRRYTFVRETRAVFVPYILDSLRLSSEELRKKVELIGMDVTSQNDSLTVCAANQADPVRIFQIQTTPRADGLTIDTIRYVV